MNIETIRKFTLSGDIQPILPLEKRIFRAGNLFLKPIIDADEYLWIAYNLRQIDFGSIKVAKPVLSLQGNYIEDAYGASQFFENFSHNYNFEKGLCICRKLNVILRKIDNKNTFPNDKNNAWKHAHSLAWSKSSGLKFPEPLNSLLKLKKHIDLPVQLVHVDLSGNIITNDDEVCVIDFTPGYFPKEYAEAIMIVDYVSWYSGDLDLINNIHLDVFERDQILLRALIFRMSVSLFFDENLEMFHKDLPQFKKMLTYFGI